MQTDDQPHIIVEGNAVTGLKFHGPFDDLPAALEWGRNNVCNIGIHEWTAAPLMSPSLNGLPPSGTASDAASLHS